MLHRESWLTLSGISTRWCIRWLRCGCLADMEGIHLSRFEQENSDLKSYVSFGWSVLDGYGGKEVVIKRTCPK